MSIIICKEQRTNLLSRECRPECFRYSLKLCHKRMRLFLGIILTKRNKIHRFSRKKLSDIAEAVHLSPIHFHNIFTEGAGISPHKYLINCRIENAKKLLWDTEIPISDVAEKSGFGCQQYLNKIFKSETGLTPATYRKNFQDNYEL